MRSVQNLPKNLEFFRKIKNQTLAEFSEALGIPKSTMSSILGDGNTTLYTAILISNNLGCSLDALLEDSITDKQVDMLSCLLSSLSWYSELSQNRQEAVAFHLAKMMEVIRDDDANASDATAGQDM